MFRYQVFTLLTLVCLAGSPLRAEHHGQHANASPPPAPVAEAAGQNQGQSQAKGTGQQADALAGIGKVILSVGSNYATDLNGKKRDLKRNGEIFLYDRVHTGSKGRLHIRFADGTSVNLKPASVLRMAQYSFSEEYPQKNGAVLQLLRGGLRTISGKIGKTNPDNYRLQTVLATVGIRGTEYELYLCNNRCAAKHAVPAGVAGGVEEGGIAVDTIAGNAALDPGLYFELSEGTEGLAVGTERPAILAIDDPPKPPPPPPPPKCAKTDDSGLRADVFNVWFSCDEQAAGVDG